MKNKTTSTWIIMAMFVLTHCGPKQAEKKTIDPNFFEDGGFKYTFGVPEEFSVSEADLGATISYAPNPTVKSYKLHFGDTEELLGTPLATANGFDSPLDVGDANIIRIQNGSLPAGSEFYAAVEAFNSEGKSSGLTAIKSITVRDLIGVEVAYRARLYACVSGKTMTRFSFEEGKLVLSASINTSKNEDSAIDELPGQGGKNCAFEGVKLELQKIINGNAAGPFYRFPEEDTLKIYQTHDDFIALNVTGSHPDFENMVTTEPMTVGFDGEMRKNCQNGGLDKYSVKARDGYGPVEDDDPINTIQIDTSKCSKNNWTTFHTHPDFDNIIEFNLFFQTGE
ncbi:MAG: hypothetical protein KDK51_07575 [Deltaproteobacteria bacterium]|nr:hypothetical protein [Deltaproteobacteria bacterium]